MARRRLEAAIQAGKAIQQESLVTFAQTDRQFKYRYNNEREGVYSLQFSYDANVLAVGYGDGTIEVVDTNSGQSKCVIRSGNPKALAVMVLRFHPKQQNMVIAGSSDGYIYSGSVTKEAPCRQILKEPDNEINCLDFNQEGDHFATAGRDHCIRIYDTETLKDVVTYPGSRPLLPGDDPNVGHVQRIFALKYHPDDNNVFISGGWDNALKIWDCRTDKGLQSIIPGPHISGDGLDIKVNVILTASWVQSDALQLWDYRKCELLKNLSFEVKDRGHSVEGSGDMMTQGMYLYCGQFCTSSVVIAGGTGTNSVQAVNIDTNDMLVEVPLGKPVYAVDTAQNGRFIAVGGAGSKMLLNVMS